MWIWIWEHMESKIIYFSVFDFMLKKSFEIDLMLQVYRKYNKSNMNMI